MFVHVLTFLSLISFILTQVFPPMQLSPRNITLLVGCDFQVRSIGGPQPQGQVDYVVRDNNVGSITSSGLLTAHVVGRTRVTGKAMGLDTEAGSSVVYSQVRRKILDLVLLGYLFCRIKSYVF